MDSTVKIMHDCKALRTALNVVRHDNPVQLSSLDRKGGVNTNEKIYDSVVHEERRNIAVGSGKKRSESGPCSMVTCNPERGLHCWVNYPVGV